MELASERRAVASQSQDGRVLVFSVDDGLFSVHLDWVEAVYEGRGVETHRVRVDKGPWHEFLLHRGEPALIVDLREAFDLGALLGSTERMAYLVLRSGGYRLAVAIDSVSGVQDLDLSSSTPVPTSLQRDGGIPAGHIVQADDRMLVVLDPHRLLSAARRSELEPIWSRAGAYAERQGKMIETWQALCDAPTLDGVKAFSRLCGRNGRPRGAAAARAVAKAMTDLDNGSPANGTSSLSDRIVSEVVRLSRSGASGVLNVENESGGRRGSIYIESGRVIDAQHDSDWGRIALRTLLTESDGRTAFAEGDLAQHAVRVSESSVATLISSLEAVASEQRKRRAR